MCFKAYAERIASLKDFDEKIMQKNMIKKRFQVKNTEMKMIIANKVQFASLNNKRYYPSDGITSLLFGSPLSLQLQDNKNYFPKTKKPSEEEKYILLRQENVAAVFQNQRLKFL